MAYNFFPAETVAEAYDVVWCNFPYHGDPSMPACESHPCLVRQPIIDSDGNPWVLLIGGTSRRLTENVEASFQPTAGEREIVRLKKATKFQLDCELRVPWCSEFFPVFSGRSVPLRHPLSANGIRELQTQAAYYQVALSQAVESPSDTE